MHYGIVWGERQRVFPQDFPLILWEYSLSFPPYNTIMHCDNFSIDIVYYKQTKKTDNDRDVKILSCLNLVIFITAMVTFMIYFFWPIILITSI